MNSRQLRLMACGWPGLASAAVGILLASTPAAARQSPLLERLAESRQLYEAAEYDRALAVMETIDPRGMAPDLARDRALYQALCLFALGLRVEAAARIEAAFELDPLFRPGNDLSPQAQSFIDEVGSRVRPSLAQQRYRSAKAFFDSGQFDAAVREFAIVLELTKQRRGMAQQAELADVRTLAIGFRDLAEHALASGRGASSRRPALTLPPEILSQDLPSWPSNLAPSALLSLTGLYEIVVSARGEVGSVNVLRSIHPIYDQSVIAAAKRWRYRPATRDGEAVAYVKQLTVNVTAK
jgi:TonB family protein